MRLYLLLHDTPPTLPECNHNEHRQERREKKQPSCRSAVSVVKCSWEILTTPDYSPSPSPHRDTPASPFPCTWRSSGPCRPRSRLTPPAPPRSDRSARR